MRVFVALVIFLGAALCIDARADSMTYGLSRQGTPLSCGTFSQEVGTAEGRQQWRLFTMGFATGTNLLRDRNQTPDIAGMFGWLEQYCTSHPLDDLFNAYFQLDRSLGRGQQPQKWDSKIQAR